jgi:transposase
MIYQNKLCGTVWINLDIHTRELDLIQYRETRTNRTSLKKGHYTTPGTSQRETIRTLLLYGLISNFRRSWSKVGERTIIDSQISRENRYLFSAVSPLTGNSFHISSIDGFDSEAVHTFLLELKKKHTDKTVILVWDNAPCHKPHIHQEIPGLIILFLPPYSPELNPAERFFEELRKSTANQIFKTIEEQETVIEKRLNELADNTNGIKQLLGYEWIRKQVEGVNTIFPAALPRGSL